MHLCEFCLLNGQAQPILLRLLGSGCVVSFIVMARYRGRHIFSPRRQNGHSTKQNAVCVPLTQFVPQEKHKLCGFFSCRKAQQMGGPRQIRGACATVEGNLKGGLLCAVCVDILPVFFHALTFCHVGRLQGDVFRNHLRCYPVSSDHPGEISHIVGVLSSVPKAPEGQASLTMMSAGIKAC